MTLASRLLIAGVGSGGFTPPPPAAVTIAASPQGGSVVVNAPWAMYSAAVDKTFIAYVRGDNGNIEIVAFDNATRTTSSPFVLHTAYEVDLHAAPAVRVLASGHIVVAYSKHGAAPINVRVSTNPNDITAWGSEQSLSHGASTYCSLHELTAEGKLYCFFRWRTGSTNHLLYIVSTDGGLSWGADVEVYAVSGEGTYWHVVSNGVDRIDVAVTDIVPSNIGGGFDASLGHFYMTDDGDCYTSAGVLIAASRPFGFSSVTKFIDGPTVGGGCFPFDIAPGPSVAVNVYVDGTEDGYWSADWNGSAWATSHIADAGGTFDVGQATGVSHDRSDTNRAVVGMVIGGVWQMVAFTRTALGSPWVQGATLTANTGSDLYAWVQAVEDGPSDLRHVVNVGTITNDTTYALGTVGLRGG